MFTQSIQMAEGVWDSDACTARRCLDLIQRHAPRLMIVGGGSTPREVLHSGVRTPPEVRERMVELRRAGRSLAEIAAATGYSKPTIVKITCAAGLGRRRAVGRCTDAMRADIRRRRALGHPVKVIAAEMGLNVSTIYHYQP